MNEDIIKKLANLLVNYSIKVKKGEYILLKGSIPTLPLLRELYKEVLVAGGYPELMLIPEGIQKTFYENATEDQLKFIPPLNIFIAEKFDAQIIVMESFKNKELSDIDMNKILCRKSVLGKAHAIMFRREEEGLYRWCVTQYPTKSVAENANMTLEECEEALFKGGLLHTEDPICEWRKISKEQQSIVSYLNTKSRIYFLGKRIDLKMKVEGRRWVNCDGRSNFPDGEVFTSPIEDSVEGYIEFNYPLLYDGSEIENINLHFEKGRVIKASATKGQDILLALLSTDEGASRVGEIAIGTNYGVENYPGNLFTNEKMAGTMHLALGASLPGTQGKNISAVHIDLVADMRESGEIYADGEMFYKKGRFKI